MDYEVSLLHSVERGLGVRTFRFERPAGLGFESGQYFLLRLAEGLVKPFSFSSSPSEVGYFEFTTRMSASDFKSALSRLKSGDRVRVSGPNGRFTLRDAYKRVVFLAGGIGITPFHSMCKWATDRGLDCDIILFWGVKTIEDAFFRDDFKAMMGVNARLKSVYIPYQATPGWSGPSGFISEGVIRAQAPDVEERAFYVCGPPKMVESMDAMLAKMKIAPEMIVKEQFG
jgi:glycine betaine catabolism B